MTAVLRPLQAPGISGQVTVGTAGQTKFGAGVGVAGILAVVAFFACLLLLANFHVVVIGDQLEFDRLENRLESGLEEAQTLRNEVARLESPDRILSAAEGRLGMEPPPERLQLALVLDGDSRGSLSPPSGDPFSGGSR